MAYWSLYRSYPKTSRRLTKGFLLLTIIAGFIGAVYDSFLKPRKQIDSPITLKGQYSSQQLDASIENKEICFSVKLMEYPQVVFAYKNPNCNSEDKEIFQKAIQTGDTLLLSVNKSALQENVKEIQFSKLVYKDKVFFSSDPDNKEDINYFPASLIWLGLLCIGLVVYLILDNKGIIEKLKAKYYTEPAQPLTSTNDFNEFPE